MQNATKVALLLICALASNTALAQEAIAPITADSINGARLIDLVALQSPPPVETGDIAAPPVLRDPALVKLQVLLDQRGASPGVIDGFDGDNLRKSIIAFQVMSGLPVTGVAEPAMLAGLDAAQPVVGSYTITEQDVAAVTAPTPDDYAEKATMAFLGYASVAEQLAERFHMDIDLLVALNPGTAFAAGDTIVAVIAGQNVTGAVTRIEADKQLRQVRAYDANGVLLAAYPATIGSDDNPSPSGSYVVDVVAPMPDYTYNPAVNFQQGENTDVLTIPPGPNGPVGSMWIALSKPTYGIHGTPEPSQIDKTGSHGCVRLTNWDAEELASMVAPGVQVDFL